MLFAQKDAITKITGIITPESIDGLENELGGAFTKLKSTHFEEGQRYSFLATVIPQEKYRIVINDTAWVYEAPANLGAYAAAALVAGVSAAQRENSSRNTRKSRRRMPITLACKKREKSSCSTEWATTLSRH